MRVCNTFTKIFEKLKLDIMTIIKVIIEYPLRIKFKYIFCY